MEWTKCTGNSVASLLLMSGICFAEDSAPDLFEIVSDFRSKIYQTGERTGGSEEEWLALEQTAGSAMKQALQNRELSDPVVNEKGQTPLHVAAAEGFSFLVDVILSDPIGNSWINMLEGRGLTPYEYAQIATPETVLACHPEIENPFVLVPFFVKAPYYRSRSPFPKIHAALTVAGTDRSIQSAKNYWLENCAQQDEVLRAKVQQTEKLYETLQEISIGVARQNRLKELNQIEQDLRELNDLIPLPSRLSPKELEEQIDQMYRDEGFER